MNSLASRRKILIRWIIGVILAIDVALLGYAIFRHAPGAEEQRGEELRAEAQLVRMRYDVKLSGGIRDHLGEVRRQCDDFFSHELRPAATGYSNIVGDLNAIGRQAGLRMGGLSFVQHEIGNRGVLEIEITGAVEGAYPSLVSFINGLERSKSFYVLESLELASSSGSALRMNLRLKTYFRS